METALSKADVKIALITGLAYGLATLVILHASKAIRINEKE